MKSKKQEKYGRKAKKLFNIIRKNYDFFIINFVKKNTLKK